MLPNKPDFKSNIPDHLLENVSKEMRWVMEEMSKQGQCQSYLLDNQFQHGEILEKQNRKLDEIDSKAAFTNGKIANAILQINELEKKNKEKENLWEEVQQVVDIKKHITAMLSSKITYIVAILIIVGSITVFKNESLSTWIQAFFP